MNQDLQVYVLWAKDQNLTEAVGQPVKAMGQPV